MKKEIKKINKIFKFRKMTEEEQQLLLLLRKLVKEGKITVEEGHRIWEEKVKR